MDSSIIRKVMQKNEKKGNINALVIFVAHILTAAMAAYGNHLLIDRHLALVIPVTFLTIFFIATRFRALGNMIHEASHNALVKGKKANNVFGHILCVIDFTCFTAYRKEHTSHHGFLGSYEEDLDFKRLEKYGFHKPLTWKTLILHIIRPLSGLAMMEYLTVTVFSKDDPKWVIATRLLYYAILITFGIMFPLLFLLYFLLPYAYAYSAVVYLTDFIDHGGLLQHQDGELRQSRNLILKNPIMRWIFFPRNDCYHLIHHLLPTLAVENFGWVHKMLKEELPGYEDADNLNIPHFTSSPTEEPVKA